MAGMVESKKEIIRRIKNSAPIFIIGCQRSGTTFLFQLIQQYLKIGFGRDNGHFVRLLKMIDYYGDLGKDDNLKRLIHDIVSIPEFKNKRFKGLHIDPDKFISVMENREYAEVVRTFYAEWAHYTGNIRWGGKTPDYTLHMNEMHELFPDAKFIHIIRDGRDVALSLFRKKWGPKNVFLAARYWKRRVQAARELGEKLDKSTYMELHYENLLQNPGKEFERIIHFIEYEADRESIIQRFQSEIGSKIRPNNYGKWKKLMSESQIKTFEKVAGDLLRELGYEIVHPEVLSKKTRVYHIIYYNIDNALRKLLKGQGFKGLYEKIYRFIYDSKVKLSFYLRKG